MADRWQVPTSFLVQGEPSRGTRVSGGDRCE